MSEVYKDVIAVFDDSFQPTGNTKGSLWPPSLSIEMKKLRHELTLTVEGPESGAAAARECVQRAAQAGLLGAVAGAFVGVGLGATTGAWAAAQAELVRCMGEQFSARIDDNSHWITWWT